VTVAEGYSGRCLADLGLAQYLLSRVYCIPQLPEGKHPEPPAPQRIIPCPSGQKAGYTFQSAWALATFTKAKSPFLLETDRINAPVNNAAVVSFNAIFNMLRDLISEKKDFRIYLIFNPGLFFKPNFLGKYVIVNMKYCCSIFTYPCVNE
jgi:hypothetical protein